MALALRSAFSLKPEIRLAQAVSEFEAALDAQQKASFRNSRSAAQNASPTENDVMRLTAEIDSGVRQKHDASRCFGPRLTNVLQAVQQFAALGDVVVGGSQNLIACGVWSAVRMVLHMCIGHLTYLERLSTLFMTAGRQAPRYQAMALIYPQSKHLQDYLCEYFIVIVRICCQIQQFAQKSALGQLKSSLNDFDLKGFQSDLNQWSTWIKDEVALLLNQRLESESRENSKARELASQSSTRATHWQALESKVRWLDVCSTYDFQTTWKQTRKRGSTTLLSEWDHYKQWKNDDDASTILFSGKLGAGKSVTLANIVDDLYLKEDKIVVYFFCRHDSSESLKGRTILGSLARQFVSYFPIDSEIFKGIPALLDSDDLIRLLNLRLDNRKKFLLVDGLDECTAEELRNLLRQLSDLPTSSSWRLGLSARSSPERIIENNVPLRWQIPIPTDNPDIQRYIDTELRDRVADGRLVIGDPDLVAEIRSALLGGANGMFLWVALQLNCICSEVSDHAIRLAIKSLPRDLTETYARILKTASLPDTGRYHIRILKFLAAAYEPLSTDQIREMASVTVGNATWNPSKQINQITRVLGFCGSIIMIDEEENTVRFVHHSAKSFCQGTLEDDENWDSAFSIEEAHREIGETAVTYLNYGVFDTRLATRNLVLRVDAGKIPERVARQTLGSSHRIARLTSRVLKPKQTGIRDVGHVLAQNDKKTEFGASGTSENPFFAYATKFWILHTRHSESLAVQDLWCGLVDQRVDEHNWRFVSCVVGPLDELRDDQKRHHDLALLWAINYSHVMLFNRLIESSRSRPSSPKSAWNRLRSLRNMLSMLATQQAPFNSTNMLPRMAARLLSIAVVLRVNDAIEWIIHCFEFKQLQKAFQAAAPKGSLDRTAAMSRSKTLDRSHILTDLLVVAASCVDARLVYLLIKMGAAQSTLHNTHALLSALRSGINPARQLRVVFMLINAGINPHEMHEEQVSMVFSLLEASPYLNASAVSIATTMLLEIAPPIKGFYYRIFRQACVEGNFRLAKAARSRQLKVGGGSSHPYDGSELPLVLRTSSGDKLAFVDWLIDDGAPLNGTKEFPLPALYQTLLLRDWKLAAKIVERTGQADRIVQFSTENELLHHCVLTSDVVGAEWLVKCGMDINKTSAGPAFPNLTPLEALALGEPDYCWNWSIVSLFGLGINFGHASQLDRQDQSLILIEDAMERLLHDDNPETWELELSRVRESAKHFRLGRNAWMTRRLFYQLAANIRRTIRIQLKRRWSEDPRNRHRPEIDLQHLGQLWGILYRCFSSISLLHIGNREVILFLSEVCGTMLHLDMGEATETFGTSGSAPLALFCRWQAQLRLFQIIDLVLLRLKGNARNAYARPHDDLAALLSRRPMSHASNSSLDSNSYNLPIKRRNREDVIIRVLYWANTEGNTNAPWFLQYLTLRSQGFSISLITSFFNSLDRTFFEDFPFSKVANYEQGSREGRDIDVQKSRRVENLEAALMVFKRFDRDVSVLETALRNACQRFGTVI